MTDIVERFVPCPYCRGKTACDCDVCFGRGRIEHPGDVAKTLTTLRARLAEAEKERDDINETLAAELAETLETFRLLGLTDEASFACDTATKAINRRIEELRADARVLAAEVEAWRNHHDTDESWTLVQSTRKATDASGALGRHGKKESRDNG